MRLSDFEIESIRTIASRHFGSDVHVFLFGSRTIDSERGGDIDLFVTTNDLKNLNTETKIAFVTDLIMQIGEQRIDVVLDNKQRRENTFFRTISKSGLKLC